MQAKIPGLPPAPSVQLSGQPPITAQFLRYSISLVFDADPAAQTLKILTADGLTPKNWCRFDV